MMPVQMRTHQEAVKFIWSIADLLRGPYRPPQYERVMLPMTVLRRFDAVLAPTKDQVLAEYQKLTAAGRDEATIDLRLQQITKYRFHNHSGLGFQKLLGDPSSLNENLNGYIKGFSANVRKIFEYFEFDNEIARLTEHNLLFLMVKRFSEVDLHPDTVDNVRMGLIFEELIRRFNEAANETAGDYFTPREVIRLMVGLLLSADDDALTKPGTVRKLFDAACGTGGMLSEAQKYMRKHHEGTHLYVYGQDFNPRAFAIAASDLLMKEKLNGGQKSQIEFGDSLIDDKFNEPEDTFDYFLANPPFGLDWKKQRSELEKEHRQKGFAGRFGAGTPRVSDGALLFLQHMWSKRRDTDEEGSRLAIVFNGSPLFSGGAGSGESEIRRWIIENDWLEGIVALPEQMFYNTGIATYVWILTNRKTPERKGKIQMIDARQRWVPMRKSQGQKRRRLGEGRELNELTNELETNDPRDDIKDIIKCYGEFRESPTPEAQEDWPGCRIMDNADFGYVRVTVERPLRLRYQMSLEGKERFLNAAPHLLDDVQAIDKRLGREPRLDWNKTWDEIQETLRSLGSKWKSQEAKVFREVFTERAPEAEPVVKSKSRKKVEYEPDSELRDFENIPLKQDIEEFFAAEVKPYVPDAWMDREKNKVGYEINFNRLFYVYKPPRPMSEIDAELIEIEKRIANGLRELLESSG